MTTRLPIHRPLRRTVAALAIALVALGLTAPAASAAVGCAETSEVLTVSIADGADVTITKSGSNYDITGVATCSSTFTPTQGLVVLVSDTAGTDNEAVAFVGFAADPAFTTTVNLRAGGGDYVSIEGTSGDDTLSHAFATFTGVEVMEWFGGDGDDTFVEAETTSLPDTYDGGDGFDVVSYRYRAAAVNVGINDGRADGASGEGDDVQGTIEAVVGGAGDDTIVGSAGDNTLLGSDGDDAISGGAGADHLSGGAGNDTLVGGAGADDLLGSSGSDTASYATSGAAVNVTLGGSATGGDAAGDTLSVENVTGSRYADTLIGDAKANTLTGGDGNDTLEGRGGDDRLVGGAGKDTVSYVGSTAVTVNLSKGKATGLGTDSLSGVENVTGSSASDTLTGNGGANLLSGGAGNDTLSGLGGGDTLLGGAGRDTMDGGDGSDACNGGDGTDIGRSCEVLRQA